MKRKKQNYFGKRDAVAGYLGTKDFLTRLDGMPFMFRWRFAVMVMRKKAGGLL